MSRPLALIVDDEPDICELLGITLKRMDIETRAVHDVSSARHALEVGRYDICLTDMQLPDGSGLDLVEWMQENAADIPVAVITAHGNVESAVRALKLGAFDFVSKPLDLAGLRRLVNTALRLRTQTPAPPDPEADENSVKLIGESSAMHQVRELISKVSRSQAPVHICGESGTGKELVARLIHESGARAGNPFLPVNCGAIPDELMESEFFGHKKGSFTGAVADKEGLFRSADGGTLFLDEVADLPLHMQVKLLRVIQEKSVRPVGESHERRVDVRILSATHRNLAQLVKDGRFREDLFYRINVIELLVPPLRDRDGDVLLLADSILSRLARSMNMAKPELGPAACERLLDYPFPGNVRELENILERALTLAGPGRIEAEDLALRQGASDAASEQADALDDRLDDVQRKAIEDALAKTGNNKTAAAQLLGMSFRQLRYRIKKLGLD